MKDVGQWLRNLGLGRYEQVFADQEIDEEVLPELDADDLKDLGVAVGHRRKLIKAIQALQLQSVPTAQRNLTDRGGRQSSLASKLREAERRQLTVMFCDLVGSTALSEMLDPEDLSIVIQDYRSTCSEIIDRFDGLVARYIGDALLIYFGYPHAHEDDPERSLRAALEISKAIVELQTLPGLSLQVRIGIATGPVVVGDIVGENVSEENAVLGRTPNLAARLKDVSLPSSIVISRETHRLAEGLFIFDDLGPQSLKGIRDPVQAFHVVKESDAPSRFEASIANGITPLVGRCEEINLLMSRWTLAKGREGQVVLICGEPGVGKSRIVKAFRDQLADEPHERILLFCWSHHRSTAFYPLIENFERQLRFKEGDDPYQKLARLETMLQRLSVPLDEHLPWLALLLAIPIDGERPDQGLRPEELKGKMLESALAVIDAMAGRKPLLVVIEDLQWSDPSTIELFGRLIDRMRSAKVMLVGTHRVDFTVPWSISTQIATITLKNLSLSDCRSMIGNIKGSKELPDDIIQEILSKADGMPLFVEELTKNVLESDHHHDSIGEYSVTAPKRPLEIPSSLKDSLMARLDHRESSKAAAQLAAVIGRSFRYDLIAYVWKRDRVALDRSLDELVSAGLLFKRGSGMQAEYEFKHALVQDTAYNSLLRTTRRRFHRQILRVLEEKFPSTDAFHPEILAHHAQHGGIPEKLAQYAFAAGRRFFGQSANREAVNHLERALDALGELPQNEDTIEKAIDVRLLLRYALQCLGEIRKIGRILQQTAPLIAALNDPSRTGQFKARLCNYHCLIGSLDESLTHGLEAMRIARKLGDKALEIEMAYRLGQPYYHLANFDDAIGILERGVALIDPEYELDLQGKAALPSVVCRAWLAVVYAELGDFALGEQHARHAMSVANEARYPLSVLFSRWGHAHICLRKQNYGEALNSFEEALHICERSMLMSWFPRIASSLAIARALNGTDKGSLSLLERARGTASSMGMTVDAPILLERLASVHQVKGDIVSAATVARSALDLARKTKTRGYEAWALRRLGEIHAEEGIGQADKATQRFQEALSLSQTLSMRPLIAICHEGMARIHEKQKHQERANAAYQAATAIRAEFSAKSATTISR